MGKGDLYIVGGAEKPCRAEILRRFVHAAGGPDRRFLIVPTATADPLGGLDRMRAWFGEVGVPRDNVDMLHISKCISGWEGGAEARTEVDKVRLCHGLWFLGGDQNLTCELLLRSDGDTPVLAAIRARHAEGTVLGGTSAGAAIMSDLMIGGGTSFGALALPRAQSLTEAADERRLCVTKGLGFFPEGIVDQHFDARARLGRLAEAALVEDGGRRLAFGVAEATALVYSASARTVSAVGAGGVYVVDTRKARRALPSGRIRLEDIELHYLTDGDTMQLETGVIEYAGKSEVVPEQAHFDVERPVASGVLSGYGTLADFVARMLLDNRTDGLLYDPVRKLRYVTSYLLGEAAGAPLGWEVRLGRMAETRLFYGERYAFERVIVDMVPLDVTIRVLG